MSKDRYGLPLSTTSAAARDAYVRGVDLFLSANSGADDAFGCALRHDPDFAEAHAGLARTHQVYARMPQARAAADRAKALMPSLAGRPLGQVAILVDLVEGRGADAFGRIRSHIVEFPRDAMALAPCTGVFGLIGFSGRAGREAEQRAMLDGLATHYGDDWWFRCVQAFAEVETGDIDKSLANVERSLAQYPRNANGAHIRSHVYYESGEPEAGLGYLAAWTAAYDPAAALHCHLSWHVAIWSLELGRTDEAWAVYDAALHPGPSWGPPINTLTDAASFLYRAELAGEARRLDRWRDLSDYARKHFSEPGMAFADVHAAVAHAMAGDGCALARIADGAKGPAADLVAPLAQAFGRIARDDWATAIAVLEPVLAAHERIGGSRAQRDLVEYTLAVALLRTGRSSEAARRLSQRRPRIHAGRLKTAHA